MNGEAKMGIVFAMIGAACVLLGDRRSGNSSLTGSHWSACLAGRSSSRGASQQ